MSYRTDPRASYYRLESICGTTGHTPGTVIDQAVAAYADSIDAINNDQLAITHTLDDNGAPITTMMRGTDITKIAAVGSIAAAALGALAAVAGTALLGRRTRRKEGSA